MMKNILFKNLDNKTIMKICKILFLLAILPFVVKTSGNYIWNDKTYFYISFYGKYFTLINNIMFTISGFLIVFCYILEGILLWNIYSLKEIVVKNKKDLVFKIILTFCLLLLGEWCSLKYNNYHIFKYLIFAPLMWIFTYDDIINFLLIIVPIRLVLALPLNSFQLLIDKTNSLHSHALGFTHANNVGYITFFELLLLFYKFGKNRELLFSLLSIIVCLFNVLIINCKTASLVTILFVISIWIIRYLRKEKKDRYLKVKQIYIKIFRWLPLIILIIVVVLGLILYCSKAYKIGILKTFSARFVNQINYFKKNGITLFGKPEKIKGKYIFDCIYALVCCNFGLLVFILMMIYFLYTNNKIIENRNTIIMFIFSFFYIYSFMENLPFTLAYGILYWGSIFIDDNNINFCFK